MEPSRAEKFRRVANHRQPDLTIIIENVWDPHNVGAVLRSCDSVGITEIYVLQTEPELVRKSKFTVGKKTSGGTSKWVDLNFYTDAAACFDEVKKKYGRVMATHLNEQAVSLYELELAEPIALLFGNEHAGVMPETLALCDGNFLIPQVGMAQSLNISVACAVTLYEAYRQRLVAGMYGENAGLDAAGKEAIYQDYVARHETKLNAKRTYRRKN